MRPDFAAECYHGGAHDYGLGQLVLVDVVGELLVVAVIGRHVRRSWRTSVSVENPMVVTCPTVVQVGPSSGPGRPDVEATPPRADGAGRRATLGRVVAEHVGGLAGHDVPGALLDLVHGCSAPQPAYPAKIRNPSRPLSTSSTGVSRSTRPIPFHLTEADRHVVRPPQQSHGERLGADRTAVRKSTSGSATTSRQSARTSATGTVVGRFSTTPRAPFSSTSRSRTTVSAKFGSSRAGRGHEEHPRPQLGHAPIIAHGGLAWARAASRSGPKLPADQPAAAVLRLH